MSRKHLSGEERRDARAALDFLEQEHQNDLSLHLYSAHLIRRISSVSLQKKRGESFTEGALKTGKQLFKKTVPSPQWTLWPSIETAKDSTELDTTAPMPRSKKLFIDVDGPTDYALSDSLPPSLSSRSFHDLSNTKFPGKKFKRATSVLGFELNALFQRQINEKLHNSKQTVSIEPTPTLPLQTRDSLLKYLNGLLDEIIELRSKESVSASPLNWQDILSRRVKTGRSFERCKNLFYDEVDSIPNHSPIYYDAQINNLMMTDGDRAVPGNAKETEVLSNPLNQLPNTQEMIESSRIKHTGSNVAEEELDKKFEINKQKLIVQKAQLARIKQSLLSLSLIDRHFLDEERDQLKNWKNDDRIDDEIIEPSKRPTKRRKPTEEQSEVSTSQQQLDQIDS